MRARLFTRLTAAILALGVAHTGSAAPGDIHKMPAPMLGADPPKGAEIRDGDASVATQTGALQYSYPIQVPPGRLGQQPSLALSYSSQAPLYGEIAAGWSLSIPEIRRDTSQGILHDFDLLDGDEALDYGFISTMAGSRPLVELDRPGGAVLRRFRAQNDSTYTVYEQMAPGQPYAWRVRATDGTTYFFGDGMQPHDSRVPLSRTVDPYGNTVEYHWGGYGNGDLWIEEILYTSNPSANLPAFARVTFVWDDAPVCGQLPVGASVSRRTGERVVSGGRKLKKIVAEAFDPATGAVQHTRRIALAYDEAAESCTAPHAPIRLLTGIHEAAEGASAPRVDLPPVTFTYGELGPREHDAEEYPSWGESFGITYGKRFPGDETWPTVESMLVDVDGDGLVDRLQSAMTGTNSDNCVALWDRNLGPGLGFQSAGVIDLPELPSDAGFGESCSLNGHQSRHYNVSPNQGPCGEHHTDTYLAYRWLDLNGDGLVDLVTSIIADPDVYNPNTEEPFGPWPACEEAPACRTLDEECLFEARSVCDVGQDFCGFDADELQVCYDQSPPLDCAGKGGCYELIEVLGEEWDFCNDLDMGGMPCDFPRYPQVMCGKVPWIIYDNLGGGEIAATPRIVYNPLPLESHMGDSPSGAGGFSSLTRAIIDIDGDGLLDAVMRSDSEYLWDVWRGDGTGAFVPNEAGTPWPWIVPSASYPGKNDSDQWDPEPRNVSMFALTGLTDVDGDVLPDFYRVEDGQIVVYWNEGWRFSMTPTPLDDVEHLSRTHLLAEPGATEPGSDPFSTDATTWPKVELVDVDADGRADLVSSERLSNGEWSLPVIRHNDGGDFLAARTPSLDERSSLSRETRARTGVGYEWGTLQDRVDIDGDGIAEHVWTTGTGLWMDDEDAGQAPARLLASIDSGTGLVTRVAYAPLSDRSVVTIDAANRKASPQTRWVVASLTSEDAHESSDATSHYAYQNPVWSPDDRGEWALRGFETVRTTGPRGAVLEERYGYDVDWSGRLVGTATFPAEGGGDEPTSLSDTTYASFTLDGLVETFHPVATETLTCSNGQSEAACRANPVARRREETTWEPIQAIGGTGEVLAATRQRRIDGDVYDAGDRETVTSHVLYAGGDAYRLRTTGAISTWRNGASDEVFARSTTVWDPSYRFALEEHVYTDATTAAITVRQYDASTGQVMTVTRPEQREKLGQPSTTYTYDPTWRFVASTKNPKGHVVKTSYEPGTGALLVTEGPNVKACQMCQPAERKVTDIDGLGRPIASWVSVDTWNGYQLVKVGEVVYTDTPGGPSAITTKSLVDYGGTVWTQTKVTLDGHGRPIETLQAGGLAAARTTYDYDVDGSLIRATLPDPANDSATVDYVYTYDSLGRPTGLRRPDLSGVDVLYDGLTERRTEVTGPNGGAAAVTEQIRDGFGHLVVVREQLDDAGNFASTFYDFDARDAVSRIEDADGVTTELTHDWAGRRIRIAREGREWKYGYDRNGNLSFERSPVPVGQPVASYTTTYAYDDLDRVTSRVVAPRNVSAADRSLFGIGTVTYTYDTSVDGANRVGRPYQVTLPSYGTGGPVFQTTYSYDAEGNVTEDRRRYNFASVAGIRRIRSTYGPGGRVKTIDHGDGTTTDAPATLARFGYDDRAQPIGVDVQLVGGAYQPAANLTRGVAGQVKTRARPPGSFIEQWQTSDWTYDQLGRVKRQLVRYGGTTIADQTLTYWGQDDPRSLTHAGSGLTTRTFDYAYDRRHQLTAVTTTNASFGSSYAFTPGGRLDHATVTATAATGSDVKNRNVDYVYGATDPEMLTALANVGGGDFATYAYDAAGNVTSRLVGSAHTTMLWDGDDQLRRAVTSTGREDYYYDAAGQRVGIVKRNTAGAITQVKYFHGPLEVWLDATGAPTSRLAHVALGTPVARVETLQSGAPKLELQYHSTLQSLLAAVAPNGSVTTSFAYGPYGEMLQTSGTAAPAHRRRYNDKHQDELTGLLYYGYRYYDSLSLTWTAADPMYRFAPDAAWGEPRRANLYTFDGGNPMRYMDPDGRDTEEELEVLGTSLVEGAKSYAIGLFLGIPISGGLEFVEFVGDVDSRGAEAIVDRVPVAGSVKRAYEAFSNDQPVLGTFHALVGTSEAVAVAAGASVLAKTITSRSALRPATQQPRGGGGRVLRDGEGATADELAASVGGPTGGTRVGQDVVRQQLIDEAWSADGFFTCWRCGHTSTNPADMHVGHRNAPVSKNGNMGPHNVCLEGAACNLSAGNRGRPNPGMSCAERGSCGAPYGR